MKKKKKYNPVKDVVDLTKLQVAGTAHIMVTESLPETPQVPVFSRAKRFTGQAIGVGMIVKGSTIPLKGLRELEKLSKGK